MQKYMIDDLSDKYNISIEIERLNKRYGTRSKVSVLVLFIFGFLTFILLSNGVDHGYLFGIVSVISLTYLIHSVKKVYRYPCPEHTKVFLRSFEAYRFLGKYLEKNQEWNLQQAIEKVKEVSKHLGLLSGSEIRSYWEFVHDIKHELTRFNDLFREKILANLVSKEITSQELCPISVEILNLVNLMATNPSFQKVVDYANNLQNNDAISRKEHETTRRKVMRVFRRSPRFWTILRAVIYFGVSSIIVIGFGSLLCYLWHAELQQYTGYVIVGTITLFVALHWKGK